MDDLAQFPDRPRRPAWSSSLQERWIIGVVGGLAVASATIGMLALEDRDPRRDLVIGLALLPGALAVMVWLRGVMRYRVLLTSGEITGAVGTERGYRFHDLGGTPYDAKLRDRAEPGLRLHIAYDPDDPRVSRPVRPRDFVSP